MARKDQAHSGNAEGPWFVDTRCVRCDSARHWAPDLIGMDEQGLSVIIRQPQNTGEEAALWRAAEACPTKSIGRIGSSRPPVQPFPYEMTPGVFALGHNSPKSFGSHSWLVARAEGNLMIDSPAYTRSLIGGIDDIGGISHILLSHRDDVADADRWAEHFGARVWIHEFEAEAAPYATDIISGDHTIAPGVHAICAPGHTAGHLVFHFDDKWLFTGDTLHWNHRRLELDVTPRQTWHSWHALSDSMDRIAGLCVEWLFAGHGNWHHLGASLYSEQMADLGTRMREVGQQAWSTRPNTAFEWH